MKKLIVPILILCFALTGCSILERFLPQPTGESANPTQTTATQPAETLPEEPTETIPEETTQPPTVELTVHFQYMIEGSKEYAVIFASDPAGNIHWTMQTGLHEVLQLTGLWGIGSYENMYYYIENGHVVALEIATGTELWRNTEFGGAPGNERCYFIDDNGDIHLTGFFGPDYFCVSKDGKTLQSIAALHKDYFWASSIQKADGKIVVCFSGGPEGDMGPDYYKVPVD